MKFGEKIAAFIEGQTVTRPMIPTDFAKATDISSRRLKSLIAGTKEPDATELLQISRETGYSIDNLLSDQPLPTVQQSDRDLTKPATSACGTGEMCTACEDDECSGDKVPED